MMEALGDASPESLVTEESIAKALRELLPTMDTDTATLKVVMQKLAARFGMEFGDFKAQWRPHLKAVLPEMMEQCLRGAASEEDDDKTNSGAEEEEEEVDLRPSRKRTQRTSSTRNAVVDASDEEEEDAKESDASEGEEVKPEEDEDEEEEDDVAPVNKRRKQSDKKLSSKTDGPSTKKARIAKEQDPPGLAALKELGRAAGVMNPRLYRLLKGATSTEEAEDILRERLQDASVSFNGTYPSSRDISAAKRKHDKAKELEGIDTSLIITGGRSRRGASQPRISYKEDRVSGEEDNADEDDEDDKDAEEFGGSDSDSSEASF